MVNQERLVQRFLKYVQIDSETRNEKEFADALVAEMNELGLEIIRDNAARQLVQTQTTLLLV